ncbi:MAG: hypothetical protein CL832_07645 [Crocinitomicaceae bacterium]|nr:hypothetical protein [Crocinitomicaceae bacterium]
MLNLEPTYLRYVYDSLNKGSLNAENAAALPRGFIGLYEQEFSQKTPAGERKKVLNQLALWALFKGPVSVNMAAAVLELEEEQMKDLVDTYYSWFNSPESSKYQLYHERLRVYLLQKLKADEVQVLNEELISFLEDAIKQANGEEDEYYALAHLHQHMALESQLGNHYERLHSYVNQESLWRRQIQLSKGYAWSQNAVQQGIKEGARRNYEMNTIRSTVNSVKLMTQEQNSADEILNLLNEGDYLTALKRAETWEGERQFKLYLLFIHELTIGTSKEADFRKEACKAVLEAIDQTPEDHSVLDWCKFYPELAVYKYHKEFIKMELDALVIWKRGGYNLSELINREDVNIYILKTLATELTDARVKSNAFLEISKILMDEGKKEESKEAMKDSLKVASELSDDLESQATCRELSKILMLQGQKKESIKLVSEIKDANIKSDSYRELSKILMLQGQKKESKIVMQKSISTASKIADSRQRSKVYIEISKTLMELKENDQSQKLKKKALKLVNTIVDSRDKSVAYIEISKVLMELGKKEESQQLMKESLKKASEIKDASIKSNVYAKISNILMHQGNIKELQELIKKHLNIASDIKDDYYKIIAFVEISIMLMKLGKKKESFKILSEIKDNNVFSFYKVKAVVEISKILMKQRKQEESLRTASKISNDIWRSKAFLEISKIIIEQGDLFKYLEIMRESLKVASDITFDDDKTSLGRTLFELYASSNYSSYIEISKTLMEQGKKKESLELASEINYDFYKFLAFKNISVVLIQQGKNDEFLSAIIEASRIATEISDDSWKFRAYSQLSIILMEHGKITESIKVTSEITNAYSKSMTYLELSKILKKQGKKQESQKAMKESLELALDIKGNYDKALAYLEISKTLIKQDKKQKSKEVMKVTYKVASKTDERESIMIYIEISKVLMELGEKEESLKVATEITNTDSKSKAYRELSKILMKQRKKKESLELISHISNDYSKSIAIKDISKILMEIGEKEESLKLASQITDASLKSEVYSELSKILMEQGKKDKSLQIAEKIKIVSCRLDTYNYFGKTLPFEEAQNLISSIASEENIIEVIKVISENIYDQMEPSEDLNPYLYNYSYYTQNLSNILFHQAKMACFFEEERNEEKLDMLSEVLDIKDWRRISASA